MKQIIRIFGMMVVVLLSSLSVSAYDFEVDGINYDITSFTELLVTASSISDSAEGDIVIPSTVAFNGKTLSVTAIGDNFAKGNLKITTVHIEEGLKEIGSFAFSGCKNLSTALIPESIAIIKPYAFNECISIQSIAANGLETLGESCFKQCLSIENATLPKLNDIPTSAFFGCSNLHMVDISSTQSIGDYSFAGCAFHSFVVPEKVQTIGESAFMNCVNIGDFVIPNNVVSLGNNVFKGCVNLNYLSIGTGVTYFPDILDGCKNLRTLRFEDSPNTLEFAYIGSREFTSSGGDSSNYVRDNNYFYDPSPGMFSSKDYNFDEIYIGRNITTEAFEYRRHYEGGAYTWNHFYYIPNPPFANAKVAKITLSPSVNNLTMCELGRGGRYRGTWAGSFQNCNTLECAEINSSASNLPSNFFSGCSKLVSVELPSSIKIIKDNALYNCSNLEQLTLGCYTESIGTDALTGCESLVVINLRCTYPPIYTTGFSSHAYINTRINIPLGSVEEYKNTEPWKNFWNLEENADLISIFEVDGIKYLVTTNHNVQIIGESLPSNVNLTLSSTVAYSGIEYNVMSIAANAFKGCLKLESLAIEEGIESIGNNAFEECKNLKSIFLPESLNNIGEGAFKNCSSLETCNFTKPIEYIPAECFYGCSSLLDFQFDGVISIGQSSFYGCDGITKVTITPSVKTFGVDAFRYCSNLKEFIIEDSYSSIDFPGGTYSGATSIQKKEVGGKIIQFKIQYYNGFFSGLPIEKLYIGRNLSDKSRYTISGDGGVDYYLITSYYAPFNNLPKLTDLTIGANVSVLGPDEEYISEVEMYSTPGSFKKSSNIKTVNVKSTNPPTGAEFASAVYSNAQLIVPDNTVSLYQSAEGWKDFVNIIDESSAGIEIVSSDYVQTPFTIDNGVFTWVGDSSVVSIYNVDGRLQKHQYVQTGERLQLEAGLYIVKSTIGTFKVRL